MEVSGEGEAHNIILTSKQTESEAFKDVCQSMGKTLGNCKDLLRK